jgi:hypothetical protein
VLHESRREVCVPGEADAPSGVRSRIWRYDASTGGRFSWMRNVAIDFSRMQTVGDNRNFHAGFVQASCESVGDGVQHIADGRAEPALQGFQRTGPEEPLQCDEWVHTPTVVVQHDDIGNTYHNLADHFRTWLALALLQLPTCVPEAQAQSASGRGALNGSASVCPAPDAGTTYWARPSGRAGVAASDEVSAHACRPGEVLVRGVDPDGMQLMNLDGRIMCNVVNPDGTPVVGPREDCEGPYFPQYRKWFGKGVVRGRDFASKGRVCFSALGWAVNSPESHPWAYFGEPSECDGYSPLFGQYVTHMMTRWDLTGVVPAAFNPGKPECGAASAAAATSTTTTPASSCRPYIRILYVVRKKKPFNPAPVQDRVIANEVEFVAALLSAQAGVDIEVDSADFTGMPFEEQLRRTRAAHVMIGMHGAGMVHGIHLADRDECGGGTSAVELLPNDHGEWGIGHLVSYLGHQYLRWNNADQAKETPAGTNVDLPAVTKLVAEAIAHTLEGRKAAAAQGGRCATAAG